MINIFKNFEIEVFTVENTIYATLRHKTLSIILAEKAVVKESVSQNTAELVLKLCNILLLIAYHGKAETFRFDEKILCVGHYDLSKEAWYVMNENNTERIYEDETT